MIYGQSYSNDKLVIWLENHEYEHIETFYELFGPDRPEATFLEKKVFSDNMQEEFDEWRYNEFENRHVREE